MTAYWGRTGHVAQRNEPFFLELADGCS